MGIAGSIRGASEIACGIRRTPAIHIVRQPAISTLSLAVSALKLNADLNDVKVEVAHAVSSMRWDRRRWNVAHSADIQGTA
jgi:hypothetical protein